MEELTKFIQEHSSYAHWIIFSSSLLAGFNLPVSIDVLMLLSATLAATLLPAQALKLILAIFLGCIFASWISYWLGRVLGIRILKLPFFSKILNEKRLNKVQRFHKKRGPLALIIGRFIPFGVRNLIFMTNGIARTPFHKFIAWDALACLIWTLFFFPLYYLLGKNVMLIYNHLKVPIFLTFIAFGVTVIGVIWYKKRKKQKHV